MNYTEFTLSYMEYEDIILPSIWALKKKFLAIMVSETVLKVCLLVVSL